MTSTHKRIVDPLDSQYRGVGGWLAFLIISLTFLCPLALLSGVLKESEYWARYFERGHGLPAIIRTSDLSVPNQRFGKKLSFCHFESCSTTTLLGFCGFSRLLSAHYTQMLKILSTNWPQLLR
jgi:hypothetical protein